MNAAIRGRTATTIVRRWQLAAASSRTTAQNGVSRPNRPSRFSTSIYKRNMSSSAAAVPINDTADDAIRLADFSYDLRLESIAKYPAFPRGSSKLLRVGADGNVSFYDNFTDSFGQFAAGAHIVFNESKVVNGRLNVRSSDNEEAIEMMILDMGDTGTDVDCIGVDLKVMLRRVDVPVGTTFVASEGMGTFEVVHVDGLWEEDEHSNGNGTECTVRCIAHDESIKTVGDMLDAVGTVPIPPYLDREAEESDAEAYNNVYAAGSGSVAAPTAGRRRVADRNQGYDVDATLERTVQSFNDLPRAECLMLEVDRLACSLERPVILTDDRLFAAADLEHAVTR